MDARRETNRKGSSTVFNFLILSFVIVYISFLLCFANMVVILWSASGCAYITVYVLKKCNILFTQDRSYLKSNKLINISVRVGWLLRSLRVVRLPSSVFKCDSRSLIFNVSSWLKCTRFGFIFLLLFQIQRDRLVIRTSTVNRLINI